MTPYLNTSLNELPVLLLIAKEDLQTPYSCYTCLLRKTKYQRRALLYHAQV